MGELEPVIDARTVEPTTGIGTEPDADLYPVYDLPEAANPYWVYLNRLDSVRSRRVQGDCLNRIAKLLAHGTDREPPESGAHVRWWRLRMEHTAKLRALLQEQSTPPRAGGSGAEPEPWSPSYVNQHLTALRRVLEVCWEMGRMDTDQYQRATNIKNVKGSREKTGRHIADAEVTSLLRACALDDGLSVRRDLAVIATLHSTGLRVAEIAAAKRRDYSPGDRALQVIGKGNKQRTVNLHEDAADYLGQWLVATEHVTGPLFCPINRWGTAVGRSMSERSYEDILDKWRRAAGLPKITVHDFRRTLASNLFDMGVDPVRIAEILGHESVVTSARYDRRGERQRREIIDQLSLPRLTDLLAA